MSEFNKNHHLLSDAVFDVSSKYALLLVIFIFIISCSNKEDNGNLTDGMVEKFAPNVVEGIKKLSNWAKKI